MSQYQLHTTSNKTIQEVVMEQLSFSSFSDSSGSLGHVVHARDQFDKSNRTRKCFDGSLRGLIDRIPNFERRAVPPENIDDNNRISKKLHRDLLIPSSDRKNSTLSSEIQVLRGKKILSHQRIVDLVLETLPIIRLDPDDIDTEFELNSYGAIMKLTLSFPATYDLDLGLPGRFILKMIFINDMRNGRARFVAVWQSEDGGSIFPVGISELTASLAHKIPSREENIASQFVRAVEMAVKERRNLKDWRGYVLSDQEINRWIDQSVRRMWGSRLMGKIRNALFDERSSTSHMSSTVDSLEVLSTLSSIVSSGSNLVSKADRAIELAVLMRSLMKGRSDSASGGAF